MEHDRREINEFRWRVFGGGVPDKLVAFVCECGEPSCSSTALLTVQEYEGRRGAGSAPIVYPGHGVARGCDDLDLLAG